MICKSAQWVTAGIYLYCAGPWRVGVCRGARRERFVKCMTSSYGEIQMRRGPGRRWGITGHGERFCRSPRGGELKQEQCLRPLASHLVNSCWRGSCGCPCGMSPIPLPQRAVPGTTDFRAEYRIPPNPITVPGIDGFGRGAVPSDPIWCASTQVRPLGLLVPGRSRHHRASTRFARS